MFTNISRYTVYVTSSSYKDTRLVLARHTYSLVVLNKGDLFSRVKFEGGHWIALPINVINPVGLVVVPAVSDCTCTMDRLAMPV